MYQLLLWLVDKCCSVLDIKSYLEIVFMLRERAIDVCFLRLQPVTRLAYGEEKSEWEERSSEEK